MYTNNQTMLLILGLSGERSLRPTLRELIMMEKHVIAFLSSGNTFSQMIIK
jgi:hypothetical protein